VAFISDHNHIVNIEIERTSPLFYGIKSFKNLRSDAVEVEFEGYVLKIASLKKIIRSKKALGRPRDKIVIEILEKTLDEKTKR
jgi:hypothetical protein